MKTFNRLVMLLLLLGTVAEAEEKFRFDSTKANGSDVEFKSTPDGLEIKCAPGKNAYPGVELLPASPWNLAAFNRIEADITNLGDANLTVCLRADNEGDWQLNPWNGDKATIPAGKRGTVKVFFGYSWGNEAYKLDPSKIIKLLLYIDQPKQEARFRLDTLRPAGKTGELPPGFQKKIRPIDGVLLNLGKIQIEPHDAKAVVTSGAVQITFPADSKNKWPGVLFKPPESVTWNLSDFSQVEFAVSNPGAKPVRVFCRVDNAWANGTRNCTVADATLAPGAKQTITVPFVTDKVWDGAVKDSGLSFASDNVVALLVFTEKPAEDATVVLESVNASLGPSPTLPDWLGKRPPMPGNWKVTFEDDFNGTTLDTNRWTLPAKPVKSIWDQQSVDAASNAYVEDGCMKIRFEKPATPPMPGRKYLTCVVRTLNKFAQRYGYFESRMKLPTTMGMWPAFWMMPDRGRDTKPDWLRNHTGQGAMEVDIMEHLVRFGPFRYNIAMHWDGYQKDHKSIGTENIYFQPDKDGYVTSGLLWEPGKMTFYCNGRVVGVWQNARVSNVPAYLKYTMPMGGWGTHGYVDESKLPAYFLIDYVRVWQKME